MCTVCYWPIDGVDRDASIRVESEATNVLIYVIYVLSKPLLLDSCFTIRSTPNEPWLTNKLSKQITGLCEQDGENAFNRIKVGVAVTQPKRVVVVVRRQKGVHVVVRELGDVVSVVRSPGETREIRVGSLQAVT